MGRASHGINPVTFRHSKSHPNQEPIALTIGRLHIGVAGEMNKWMPCAMFRDDGSNTVLGHVILDEDHFLEGMYHLFPREGSMDHGDRVPASVNEELVELLRSAKIELERLGGNTQLITALFEKYRL